MNETLQDHVRSALVWITGLIPHEAVAGLAFGVALIITDHIFNLKG